MKRFLLIILALFISLSLFGCGKTTTDSYSYEWKVSESSSTSRENYELTIYYDGTDTKEVLASLFIKNDKIEKAIIDYNAKIYGEYDKYSATVDGNSVSSEISVENGKAIITFNTPLLVSSEKDLVFYLRFTIQTFKIEFNSSVIKDALDLYFGDKE